MFDLLGTKIDLREDREFVNQLQKQNIQPIKREQGQRLCKKIRAFKYPATIFPIAHQHQVISVHFRQLASTFLTL